MGLFGGGKKQGASPLRRRVRKEPVRAESRKASATRDVVRKEIVRKEVTRKESAKKKAPRAPIVVPWRALGLKSMPVLAVALVLGLVFGAWKMLDYVGSVPVSRVMVTGNLRHVDRNALTERVQPLLAGAGFMTVDLQGIRGAVLELPWVADVAIQRRWPDQLVINVTEQEAIARWGKDGLLNRRGEVFRPQPMGDVSALPMLFGPDHLAAEVVARYAELRDLLNAQQLTLANLGTDERGSWSAMLQNGLVLHLGTGDVLKKIRRFSRVYRDDLHHQIDGIAYVDLRYSNGVAVGWRQATAGAGSTEARELAVAARGRGQQTDTKQL
jgi:cell division protein FtsQ